MSTPQQRLAMAKEIIDLEARRDAQGHLKVYNLPANDGGGRFEVAGINERYNPTECKALVEMLEAGQYDRAEAYAAEFIAKDTDSAARLTKIPAVESYLRDCVFNRGAKGAVMICQHAVGAGVDGSVGPETQANIAAEEKDPEEFLKSLRVAREWYESNVVGYRENFWRGLVNRWDKALVIARKFPMEVVSPDTPMAVAPEGGNWMTVLAGAVLAIFRSFFASKQTAPVDLASRLIAAMRKRGFVVDDVPGNPITLYVEGMDPDGKPNDNQPNQFNDTRFVLTFGQDGRSTIVGAWEATTEPSKRWTEDPMNPKGAARIEFGQYTAWQLGDHHGHEALVQTGGEVTVCRDANKDFKREGDEEDTGMFGINQHAGYDFPKGDLKNAAAGCLVGRTFAGHREFMALQKAHPKFRANRMFVFTAAVIPAAEVV